MSLFEDAFSKLKGVVNATTEAYRAITPDFAENVLETAATPFAGAAQMFYTGAVEPVAKFDRFLYVNGVTPWLTSAALAVNPAYDNQVGALNNVINPVLGQAGLDFGGQEEAWKDAKTVSPVQALIAAPLVNAYRGMAPGGDGFGENILTGFDPTSPASRKYYEEGVGKWQSGTGDFLLSWYADPLVIAGKTAQVANKVRGGVGAIDQAAEIDRATTMTDAGMVRWLTKPPASPTENLLDPVIRNSSVPEVAAAAVAGVETVAEKQLIYRTMVNDLDAWNELLTKRASIADELSNARGAQTRADQAIHDYLNLALVPHPGGAVNDVEWLTSISKIGEDIGKSDPAYMALAAEVTKTKAVVEDLIRRDRWIAAATDESAGLLGSAKTQAVARSASLQAMREARLRTSDKLTNGYWVEKYGENSAAGRALRVVQWFGGYTPAGWIATSGNVTESASELRATLIQAGADVATQQKWLDRWMTSSDETARLETAGAMEDELFGRLAAEHGYSVQEANDLLTKTKLARQTARDQFRKDPTMLHSDGSISNTAQAETQLAEQTPLLNFKLLREVMESDRRSLREAQASTGAYLEGKALNGWHKVDSGLSAFNLFWKPTVLLRLGYTGRNVGESLVASFVRTGAMVADPFTGAAHVYQQLPQRLARMRTLPSHRATNREISEQVEFHVEERAHWQNQIVDIDAEIATRETYLAGHAQTQRAIAEQEAAAAAKAAEGGRAVPRTPAAIHAEENRKIAKYAAQQERTIGRSTQARDNAQRSLSRARKRKAETPEQFEARRQISRDQIAEHNLKIEQAQARKATLPARISANEARGAQIAQAEASARVSDVAVTHAQVTLETLKTERLAAEQHLRTIEDDLEQVRTWMSQIEEVTVTKPRTGSKTRTVGGISYRGAMDESRRAVTEKMVSGDRSTRMSVRNAESEQFTARRLTSRLEPTGVRKVEPKDPAYYASLQGIINGTFRPSPWLRDLMAGKPPSEVANWLRTSADGRKVMDKMRWEDDMIDGQVLKMNHMIEQYLPDAELRMRAVEGDVSEAFVRARLAGREGVGPIHGREVKEVAGYLGHGDARGALEGWENFVQKAFHLLGTLPEDAGARFPLYNHVYNQSMEQAILANLARLHRMGQAELDETLRLFETASRNYALKEVRNTVYTIERRHNVAVAARYVSPFLGVTMNRFGFYGRMLVEQPRNTARLFLGYQAIPTEVDAYGEKFIPVTLPGPVAKALAIMPGGHFDGLDDGPVNLAISKRSLNLIGQGSPWWNPGFGPPITVPVAALSRNSGEDPNWLEKLVIPYGSGHSVTDQFLPNTAQKWMAARRSSARWGSDFSLAGAYEVYRANGGMREMPTNAEIAQRADALGWIRFLSAAVSPVSTSPTNPLQTQADYMRQMRELDSANGTNNADAEFLAKYPDYFEYMVSLTKNPYGIDPTAASVERQRANTDLISAIVNAGGDPSIVGTVIDNPDGGAYDQTAYTWQKDNPAFPGAGVTTRQTLPLDEALRQREESRGWIEYNKFDTQIKDMLAARGLTSTSQSGAADLAALKGSIVDKIGRDYPAWGDAFQQRDGSYYVRNVRSFVAIAADDKMYDDPVVGRWLPQAVQYLTMRQDITNILAQRAAQGGSDTFSAQSNSDLQDIWSAATQKMSASSPAWADVFSRYFENDNMLPVGVTY